MPRAFILLFLLATVAAADLQQDLDKLFDRTPVVADAVWTCSIRNLQTGESLYRRNPDRALIPASNQKLFVAAAALHELGPDFRSTTDFFTAGAVAGGTLPGTLVVRGHGAHAGAHHRVPDLQQLGERGPDGLRGAHRGDGLTRTLRRTTVAEVSAGHTWPHLRESESLEPGDTRSGV